MKLPIDDNRLMFWVVAIAFSLVVLAFILGEYWLAILVLLGFMFLLWHDTRELRP